MSAILAIVWLSFASPETARTQQAPASATASATCDSQRSSFDEQVAFEHIKAQVNFGPRSTGTPGIQATGDYIIKNLKADGWNVAEQRISLTVNDQPVEARNIVGSIGSGPLIVFGAHYDTRLNADEDPEPDKRTQPTMGADDGASEVAALLELARVLGSHHQLTHEIQFAFFDAEDNINLPGWNTPSIGATYYIDHLPVKPENVIILDMIGDADLNIYYEANSMQSVPDLMTEIWDIAARQGYQDNFIPKIKYSITDDHTPFIQKGIRAIDIIDFDYPYHHTTHDTLDKVSAESLGKVGRVLQEYLERQIALPLPAAC